MDPHLASSYPAKQPFSFSPLAFGVFYHSVLSLPLPLSFLFLDSPPRFISCHVMLHPVNKSCQAQARAYSKRPKVRNPAEPQSIRPSETRNKLHSKANDRHNHPIYTSDQIQVKVKVIKFGYETETFTSTVAHGR